MELLLLSSPIDSSALSSSSSPVPIAPISSPMLRSPVAGDPNHSRPKKQPPRNLLGPIHPDFVQPPSETQQMPNPRSVITRLLPRPPGILQPLSLNFHSPEARSQISACEHSRVPTPSVTSVPQFILLGWEQLLGLDREDAQHGT
ncbi:uncharacterized protein LOC124650337 [Lolium rigidum]|uniref:uncharacterized protein LOC124650337 n=1 Tax=Lolium rigidum TaxID=89674 RepID=UPI001F5CCFE5|nr:uncharacterized protein LOC124650337 [Lolium rigidum]